MHGHEVHRDGVPGSFWDRGLLQKSVGSVTLWLGSHTGGTELAVVLNKGMEERPSIVIMDKSISGRSSVWLDDSSEVTSEELLIAAVTLPGRYLLIKKLRSRWQTLCWRSPRRPAAQTRNGFFS